MATAPNPNIFQNKDFIDKLNLTKDHKQLILKLLDSDILNQQKILNFIKATVVNNSLPLSNRDINININNTNTNNKNTSNKNTSNKKSIKFWDIEAQLYQEE